MGASRLYLGTLSYRAEDLAEVDYAQSTNYIYFAHLDYPPYKLIWAGHTDWTFDEVTFAPEIAAPAGVGATPVQPNATGAISTSYTYYVTATDANGQESRASAGATATNDLSLQGNYNTVTWGAVADAAFYTVYKGDNAAPGYVGSVEAGTLTFKDRNLQAILSDTPPLATNPFDSADNYPSVVDFHQQRSTWARTRNRPNAAWLSKSADFENMDVARPAKPDDAMSFALVGTKVNSIEQVKSMKKDLIALTTSGIYAVNGGEGGAMTPAAIVPEKQTGRRASRLDPIAVDSVLFYQPGNSANVRALGFTFEVDGYRSNNVSIFSPHFFKARRIVSWAYQEEPYSVIWAALDDGTLLCFTWEEEQQVWGWTMMEIAGFVEQVAVANENGSDRLYALIRRTIGGEERRFNERLALPHTDDISVACHLDCSVTQIYEAATDTIGGLWHLEGETVSATYDGYAVSGLVVENGQVTVPVPSFIISVGIPYEGTIQTLPFVLGSSQHTERQNINDVVVRTLETRGLEISTDEENFEPLFGIDESEPGMLSVPETEDFQINVPGNWTDGSTLTIRQAQPLPAHVIGIFAEVVVSDEQK